MARMPGPASNLNKAHTSAKRLFCHVYGRAKNQAQMIPGWPYSFVAALEPGRTSWTAMLDAVRLGPVDDATAVTADQLRDVVGSLIAAGQWQPGDRDILIVCDAGYDVTRLAFVLADLPVQLLGRLRSDRVLQLPVPLRLPGTNGRPPKHGDEFALAKPATWPEPQHMTTTETTRYGKATASSWDRLHPRLTHRTCWLEHPGELPVIEGTVIRLQVEHLPGDRDPAHLAGQHRLGGAPGTPQPGQHRQAHRPVQERQRHDDPGHHEAGTPGHLAALGALARTVVLPRRPGDPPAAATHQRVVHRDQHRRSRGRGRRTSAPDCDARTGPGQPRSASRTPCAAQAGPPSRPATPRTCDRTAR